jgi:hypothetical protein
MPEAAFLRITVEGVQITVDGLLVQRIGADGKVSASEPDQNAQAIRPAR